MTEMNHAQKRIWNDDAVMNVVNPNDLPDGEVRFSDEALKILREQGVGAYERYIAEQSIRQ